MIFFPLLALGHGSGELYNALGLMAPFAAVLGAVATFIAFFVQYSANQTLQKENNDLQQKNRIDVVTAHFFELLRLHKENVNELTWKEAVGENEKGSVDIEDSYIQNEHSSLDEMDLSPKKHDEAADSKTVIKYYNSLVQRQGKFLFDYCLAEFNLIYVLYKDYIQNKCKLYINWKQSIKITYEYFYKRNPIQDFNRDFDMDQSLSQIYQNLKEANSYKEFCGTCGGCFNEIDGEIEKVLKSVFQKRQYFIAISENHRPIDVLNQYYRHLYMTVKYVVTNKELQYEKKRELLRILRSQMSRQEQMLLFYNWISENGVQWEKMNDTDKHSNNHFFTDYRMIHNVNPNDCIFLDYLYNSKVEEKWYANGDKKDKLKFHYFICFFLNNSMNCAERAWKCEKENDSLFEFEDWDGFPSLGHPQKENSFWIRCLDKVLLFLKKVIEYFEVLKITYEKSKRKNH